jgi:hypothetical protein
MLQVCDLYLHLFEIRAQEMAFLVRLHVLLLHLFGLLELHVDPLSQEEGLRVVVGNHHSHFFFCG